MFQDRRVEQGNSLLWNPNEARLDHADQVTYCVSKLVLFPSYVSKWTIIVFILTHSEWLYLVQEIVVNDHILDSNRVVELLVWFAVSTKLDFDFFSIWFFCSFSTLDHYFDSFYGFL